MAKSVSRLNSAAPYNTHACPPMRSARARCAAIEERTVRIGFGIKRSSERQERQPQSFGFAPPLARGEAVPCRPFRPDQVVRIPHDDDDTMASPLRGSVGAPPTARQQDTKDSEVSVRLKQEARVH
jgi:hypothetical protein